MSKHILIMEDDQDIQEVIKEFLIAKNYAVAAASDGLEGIRLFNARHFDLVIADIMMPNLSGIEVAKMIRQKSDVPIVMLTALGEEQDQIRGFDAGIDDYITKPFSFDILVKRVEAVLRRSQSPRSDKNVHVIHEMRVDGDAYKVFIGEREVALTTKEFEIVLMLAANRGKVITRERMLENLWGYDFYGDVRLTVSIDMVN